MQSLLGEGEIFALLAGDGLLPLRCIDPIARGASANRQAVELLAFQFDHVRCGFFRRANILFGGACIRCGCAFARIGCRGIGRF
jgi:hypothetical protein